MQYPIISLSLHRYGVLRRCNKICSPRGVSALRVSFFSSSRAAGPMIRDNLHSSANARGWPYLVHTRGTGGRRVRDTLPGPQPGSTSTGKILLVTNKTNNDKSLYQLIKLKIIIFVIVFTK